MENTIIIACLIGVSTCLIAYFVFGAPFWPCLIAILTLTVIGVSVPPGS